MSVLVLALSSILGAIAAAASTPLQIEMEVAEERCRAGTITAQPLCAAGECPDAVTTTWRGERASLALHAPSEEWIVAATAPGCWSAPVRVTRDTAGAPVALRVWRAGAITGRLALPPDMTIPDAVTVRLESAASRKGAAAVPATTVRCPVASRRLRCDVPATVLDVRVSVEGVAPRYVWNVGVAAGGAADLGELKFERGGSISGFVRLDGDGPPLTEIAIEVAPTLPPPTTPSAAAEAAEAKRRASQVEKVRPNARGFFQLTHLEAGQYTVTARKDGWSPARLAQIVVEEGRETELARPLVVEPLARVEVFVQPPLDPYGKPWTVSLRQLTPLAMTSVAVSEGPATLTGSWSADGVDSGVHRLEVADHRGSDFARTTVDVTPRMPPVQVNIEAVAVDGRLTLGGEPVPARLEFRHVRSGLVVLQADAEGRFSGALPVAGKWEVQMAMRGNVRVTRHIEVVRSADGAARVDLILPDTRVAGIVVTHGGKPLRAVVHVHDEEARIVATGASGDDGRFQFRGLDPGDVGLSARSSRSGVASALVRVSVTETASAEVTLTVLPQIVIDGTVVTPTGRPVAGAFVRWMIPHRNAYNEEVTGPSGEFRIPLPHDAGAVDMVILPPAMPVKMLTVPVGADLDPNVQIVVGGPSGVLEIEMDPNRPPFPLIERNGRALYATMFKYPFNWTEPPRDRHRWGLALRLEAGEYNVCSTGAERRCSSVRLAPGTVQRVDGRGAE